jgi:hypothetical protein
MNEDRNKENKYGNYFLLGFFIMAADQETIDWFDKSVSEGGYINDDYYYNGGLSGISIDFKAANALYNFDPKFNNFYGDDHSINFRDRKEAVRFKKILIDIFDEKIENDAVKDTKICISSIPTFEKVELFRKMVRLNEYKTDVEIGREIIGLIGHNRKYYIDKLEKQGILEDPESFEKSLLLMILVKETINYLSIKHKKVN